MAEIAPGQVVEPMAASAWIEPDGTFHYVPDCNHEDVAYLLQDVSSYRLERRGWVHLSWCAVYTDKPITQAQFDAIYSTWLAWCQSKDYRATRIAKELGVWVNNQEDMF